VGNRCGIESVYSTVMGVTGKRIFCGLHSRTTDDPVQDRAPRGSNPG